MKITNISCIHFDSKVVVIMKRQPVDNFECKHKIT